MMRRARTRRNCALPGIRLQRGQALVYGLFLLIGSLAALYFLFNTGQLAREKTKLVNTGDAVAYSAGVMHARTLNYNAYANRAMVANTIAIAQLVSLSSWIQYADNMANYGFTLATPKFATFYPSYYAAQYSGPYGKSYLVDSGALEKLAAGSDRIIRQVLMNAQQVAYAALIPARRDVMNEVARANYHDDGTVSVDTIPLTANEFTSFISRYADDERTRFAELARTAAKRDRFVARRSWVMPGLWADCAGALPRVDWLDRRGGTELIGFDEWKAMDTLSEKRWVPAHKTDVFCLALSEHPAGWGMQSVADDPAFDPDLRHYDYSMVVNPAASGLAMLTSSSDWGYSGLPAFYDLSEESLKQGDPRLQFAIRLRRDKAQTVTSEGRSRIRATPRLNAYAATAAGGNELVAVAASEVFFERPPAERNNSYGRSIGRPHEIGSLFNPYWQVRLIHSDSSITAAQALQGAVLP